MIKNLTVFFDKNFEFNKIIVHKAVLQLRNILKFNLKFLQINFINSNQILEINKKYLNHNYFTDIITFNYSASQSEIDGEIFISFEEADANAKKYKIKSYSEYLRLIIHGILHLIGYNDLNRDEKLLMKKIENRLVNELKYLAAE